MPQNDTISEIISGSPRNVPVLPLRDVVVYPHMVIPLFVGREKSVLALEEAIKDNKQLLLVAQKDAEKDDPGRSDLHAVGTLASILQLHKLPDGTIKVLVEGIERVRCAQVHEVDNYLMAEVHSIEQAVASDRELEVEARALLNQFDGYVKLNKKTPPEVLTSLAGIDDVSRLADTIAAHMALSLDEKQKILETIDLHARIEHLMVLIESEIDTLQVEKRIRGRVKQQMEKSQREYYLNEQMKAIQKELGELEEGGSDIDELERKILTAGMPKEALDKAKSELNKLKMMSPMSAEASVVRNYLDWIVAVPWKKRSKIKHDLGAAEEVLDADHFGLEKVKERILEYLAVQQRVRKMQGPILCLVGPPGVGKTSLGQSIAKATNRKFGRIALGGVRDDAEIRGHRRTYVGAMPGRIVQTLTKIGSRNPLILLDEIDKMASDFRGDPAAALLEVLDPEQNKAFADHYMDMDIDLSEILFVCTANSLNIPGPLLDRMEVIRIAGYTEDEKTEIAERYLLPKQLEKNGLKDDELSVDSTAVRDVIRYYTREAGVRNLERELAKVSRKVVRQLVTNEQAAPIHVNGENLDQYLGVRRFDFGKVEHPDQIGQVTGLAWTEVGGDLLTIEAATMPGKGNLKYTGQLGEVMQESIQAAMTVVRARAVSLGIDPEFSQKVDIHVHVPEGATPKDGPSAGGAMCTAIVSALTGIPVKATVAMTGEITLRGEVLPIGGLKEKLLAAQRGGIELVLIPEGNRKDLTEIPDKIKDSLDIRPVRWIDEVLDLALITPPTPKSVAPLEAPVREDVKRPDDTSNATAH
ncbi:endopeptidase La [Halothiobacillus diazotrophicus]|uniref:Lon protease n=1 Tax=Halothiobacillus diazotrophicus TaxID=1860122 RepID=A0A191ZKM9_9GAMM|nr:endopeptidase La [Halothiobacillus diazotrophicus]ANJ68461.1 endopeptidase La [Halothiobacillus diazotrophicus]